MIANVRHQDYCVLYMFIEDRRNTYSNAELMDNYIECRYKTIQINSAIPVRLTKMIFNENK